jgi:hypothetical protein
MNMIRLISHYPKILFFTLLSSIVSSQEPEKDLALDVQRTTEFKRDVAYGQDCDDTEYRNEWGTPNWKNYGRWLSECDSIRTVKLDKEFTERRKKQQREKAIQDSIELAEIENIDFDLDAMWENTVWQEIQDVTTVYAEVEQITAVAGVRGAEAEDEALQHLYYRRSMRGLELVDIQKAYGKLKITRENLYNNNPDNPKIVKIDQYLLQLESKM